MRHGRAPARAPAVRQECVDKKLRAWHMHRHIKFNPASSATGSEGTVERRQARSTTGMPRTAAGAGQSDGGRT